MVIQDGYSLAKCWKIPTTFDNLIHEKAMPVTLGLFVTPGSIPAKQAGGMARRNRSFEYDSLGDRYARFLIEELLPEVKQSYNISDDPNGRAIGGSSAGAMRWLWRDYPLSKPATPRIDAWTFSSLAKTGSWSVKVTATPKVPPSGPTERHSSPTAPIIQFFISTRRTKKPGSSPRMDSARPSTRESSGPTESSSHPTSRSSTLPTS